MKCRIVIDPDLIEDVVIYARERNTLVEQIESLTCASKSELIGYGREGEIVPLAPNDVYAVTVEDGRVMAICEKRKYSLRERLYVLEDALGEAFIRINQSCLVRRDKIESFNASIGGAMTVRLKNGYRDYISRRMLKSVKEKMGI